MRFAPHAASQVHVLKQLSAAKFAPQSLGVNVTKSAPRALKGSSAAKLTPRALKETRVMLAPRALNESSARTLRRKR